MDVGVAGDGDEDADNGDVSAGVDGDDVGVDGNVDIDKVDGGVVEAVDNVDVDVDIDDVTM